MTDTELFVEAVAHHREGLTVAVGCLGVKCEYAEGDSEHSCEPSFSWSQCDSCGSSLGGSRGMAHGLWKEGDKHHTVELSICVDCTMFHANGDVPETWG